MMSEFDRYRETYSSQINQAVRFSGQDHDFYLRAKAEYLIDIIDQQRWTTTKPRLLDIGCGDGAIDSHLVRLRPSIAIDGIDVAKAVIQDAHERNPTVRYHVYDGERLPFSECSYEIAFTVNVMHHISPSRWPHFFREVSRVVCPSGLVVVMEHNPYNPLVAHIVRSCPIDANAVLLYPSRLKILAQNARLVDIHTRFILFTPFESRIFRQFDRLMGWLPLGAQYILQGRVPK
jgi:SAM-dependent methyltransferase